MHKHKFYLFLGYEIYEKIKHTRNMFGTNVEGLRNNKTSKMSCSPG